MTPKNAIRPVLLGLLLAVTLSACSGNRTIESHEDYAKARVLNLVTHLSSEDANVRRQAAYGLGCIGTLGKEAIPALTCALYDPEQKVRCMAACALRRMGVRDEALLDVAVAPTPANAGRLE